MQNVRSESALAPLSGGGATQVYWELLSAADGIGLISIDAQTETQDLSVLQHVACRLEDAGVAKHFIVRLRGIDPTDTAGTAELVRGVLEALQKSPLPDYEWPTLTKVFGAEELARLLRISESSLNRYANGSRPTPDLVAERLHFIALIVGDLRGAYNEVGVRRWFHRHRTALGDRAPVELLGNDWMPDDEGPEAVRALAHSLLFASAT